MHYSKERKEITSLSKHALRIQNMHACIEEKKKKDLEKTSTALVFCLNAIFQLSKFFPSDLGEN